MKQIKIINYIVFFQIFFIFFSPVIFKYQYCYGNDRQGNLILFEKKNPVVHEIKISSSPEKRFPLKKEEKGWISRNKWWLLIGLASIAVGAAAAGGGGGGDSDGSGSTSTGSAVVSW